MSPPNKAINKANVVTAFSLVSLHSKAVEEFSVKLEVQRFWHILPEGEKAAEKAIGLLDTKNYLIYPPVSALRAFLDQHPFLHIQQGGKTLATLHVATMLLWSSTPLEDLRGWSKPEKSDWDRFALDKKNPIILELKSESVLASAVLISRGFSQKTESEFECNRLFLGASAPNILAELIIRGWVLCSPEGEIMHLEPDARWQKLSSEERMLAMHKELIQLLGVIADQKNETSITPFVLREQLSKLDYTPCRLPILDNAQLSDPEKGLWELWGEDRALCKQLDLVARDPKRDIQRRAVAIDFGTSSTVVACETSSGGRELLRIGVRDFFQAVQPQHFENPTVLECLDFAAFLHAWTHQAYRPQLDWDWMRAAHEAQASFRDNPGDTRILASILPRLKQWALRDSEHRRIQLTDRQGCEIELPLHIERNPLRGQALQVCAEDPFDPVELYAWYLGMAINWRGHGLFLKYYLSFPVEYPREVRERILASFRRGLQRSLPHTLVSHYPETLNEFTVQALASEPAAYAAAALAHLKIEPMKRVFPMPSMTLAVEPPTSTSVFCAGPRVKKKTRAMNRFSSIWLTAVTSTWGVKTSSSTWRTKPFSTTWMSCVNTAFSSPALWMPHLLLVVRRL